MATLTVITDQRVLQVNDFGDSEKALERVRDWFPEDKVLSYHVVGDDHHFVNANLRKR